LLLLLLLQESEEAMGLPFDWHLRPRRVARQSSIPKSSSGSRNYSRAALGLLRPSMQHLRNFSRRQIFHEVWLHHLLHIFFSPTLR
jgi:hypothetical protein